MAEAGSGVTPRSLHDKQRAVECHHRFSMAYRACVAVRGIATCPGRSRPGRAAARRTFKASGMRSVARGTHARARSRGMHSFRFVHRIQSAAIPVPSATPTASSEQRAAARACQIWMDTIASGGLVFGRRQRSIAGTFRRRAALKRLSVADKPRSEAGIAH